MNRSSGANLAGAFPGVTVVGILAWTRPMFMTTRAISIAVLKVHLVGLVRDRPAVLVHDLFPEERRPQHLQDTLPSGGKKRVFPLPQPLFAQLVGHGILLDHLLPRHQLDQVSPSVPSADAGLPFKALSRSASPSVRESPRHAPPTRDRRRRAIARSPYRGRP